MLENLVLCLILMKKQNGKQILPKNHLIYLEVELKETRKQRAKVVECSPSLKKSKSKLKERSLLTPPKVFKNKKMNLYDEDSLSIHSFHDNDKDPDFILKSPDICEISSPIGKIRVESISDSKLINNKKTELNSTSKSMTDH
uniref:Uncharacterized protein n=1 Tax=Schizaphis graminum TaxID=13262 RepID=A0A2S2P5W4_SCHGA